MKDVEEEITVEQARRAILIVLQNDTSISAVRNVTGILEELARSAIAVAVADKNAALKLYADRKNWSDGWIGNEVHSEVASVFDWPGELQDNPWEVAERALAAPTAEGEEKATTQTPASTPLRKSAGAALSNRSVYP